MAVFRVEKNANYTTMCNYHLRDQTLSLKAKGLLSMLLSLPDTWHYSVRGLAAISREGVDGILTALKELETHGYLERRQLRGPGGRLGQTEYVIFEMPKSQPCTEKPYTVHPDTESPAQISKERVSKESIRTDQKKETAPPSRHRYGMYQNVLLSDAELEKLRIEFPADYQNRIERLSEYIASSGKHYKNHLATIRSWAKRDGTKQAKAVSYSHDNYRYEEGESL
ncbi:helix-turn-helix domain-containing protein [uncultured Gemmiger sp.]|uniref:helix-turn-helix domain-containing protein n=1 Tax=uncultured Gemmiger sp. TaxID=1623490 RepID=UPI0025FC4428|nr:helix-turn-helix domain-containing protein [uncultured Gemmiger sp.]